MIKCVARLVIDENKIEEFKTIASKLVSASRKDKGCIAYEVYQDISDPGTVSFLEEWESEEDLKLHSEAPHFIEYLPQLEALAKKPMELNVYSLLI